jgi:NAD(P)-dependent dehydrogenase (short-subunit alcohol dehydrogenase family)
MSSKYAAAHVDPKGPGDARPTALQIIQDEELEGKLQDKTFLITGCSSGIGIETARSLSATGAALYLGVRDIAKGESALHDILSPGRVELLKMDLNSLNNVRSAAKEFLERNKMGGLNVLICNAGVMALPTLKHTADGFESQFGTNHLGHFLLFNLLKDTLLASSTPEFNSRVVILASSGHRTGGIRVDDYNFTQPNSYNPWTAYGQSKTANIYMSSYIDRHFGPQGLHANAVHPGGIWTPLQRYMDPAAAEAYRADPEVYKTMKSLEQGAATTVWAAVAKEWEGKGGKYLEDCQVSVPVKTDMERTRPGYAPHAFDEQLEERLWVDSLKMVGL